MHGLNCSSKKRRTPVSAWQVQGFNCASNQQNPRQRMSKGPARPSGGRARSSGGRAKSRKGRFWRNSLFWRFCMEPGLPLAQMMRFCCCFRENATSEVTGWNLILRGVTTSGCCPTLRCHGCCLAKAMTSPDRCVMALNQRALRRSRRLGGEGWGLTRSQPGDDGARKRTDGK